MKRNWIDRRAVRTARGVSLVILAVAWAGPAPAFTIPNAPPPSKAGGAPAAAAHNGLGVTFATRAAECAVCHQQQYQDWRFAAGSDLDTAGTTSYHAQSSTEPMYRALLETVAPEMRPYCAGCHESGNAWAVGDRIADIPAPRTENLSEGINCVVCHFDGAQLVGSTQLRDPIFCATCHNEKNSFTDTYGEWLNDYRGPKTCQQCHMNQGTHLFVGLHSPSLLRSAVALSNPSLPSSIAAGEPFDVTFSVTNVAAGHSVPVDLLRMLRARVSIADAWDTEVFVYEKVFYKRFAPFGEDPAETEVIRAGETKVIAARATLGEPGIYTVKAELLQDTNRFGVLNATLFNGATYTTIVVH